MPASVSHHLFNRQQCALYGPTRQVKLRLRAALLGTSGLCRAEVPVVTLFVILFRTVARSVTGWGV